MKIDKNKLPGCVPEQETGLIKSFVIKTYRGRILKAACFAAVLAVAGGGMVLHSMKTGDGVSADEPYDMAETVPSFTVQQYADVTVPDIGKGDDGVPVITGSEVSRLATDDKDGKPLMAVRRMPLYEDYETDWMKTDSIELMSCLDLEEDGPEGWRLSEVWFGTNKESMNQSDFLVLQVPEEGLGNVALTNNPDSAGISAAEGGYYKPDSDGRYKIPITDGMTVRLIYEERESWTYADADLYDYDVTDGGYYLSSDYYHMGNRRETSSRTGDEKSIYLDAVAAGIHTEENYQKTGARFAFGADGIGTDMANESLSDSMDTLNVFNYKNEGLSGITPEIVTGTDGSGLKFTEAVSAPELFGGEAAGKTPYTEREYSLGFDIRGYTHTLSSVESAWGTCVENMDFVNSGFWILDNAPSYNTDGHDVSCAGGDESVMAFRSGDRAPVPFAATDDGAPHNRFFGLSYTADFELSPGYTGPLGFFAYGDDDIWAFAAQVGADGNIIPGSMMTVADLGGVHGSTGCYTDLWDVIEKVPYGEEGQTWRLFFYWLERDGVRADIGLSVTLPEYGMRKNRETASLMLEAASYDSTGAGIGRTFILDDGSQNRYYAVCDDGSELTVTSGQEFQIKGGGYVSIGGLTPGSEVIVSETGRDNVWHSYGDGGYDSGNEAPCVAGVTRKVMFLSTVNAGTLSIGIDAPGTPDGGFRLQLTMDGMKDGEVSAMDAGNNPLGSRMTDKDGKLELTLSAGEVITLYNLPDGTGFELVPVKTPGYRASEILLDHAGAEGITTHGELPAYVIYRFEKEEEKALDVRLEQSVSGDWSDEDLTVGEGALVSYKISVTNPNETKADVTIEDILPDSLVITNGQDGIINGQAIRWDASIEPLQTIEVSFTCKTYGSGTTENKALANGIESNTVALNMPE